MTWRKWLVRGLVFGVLGACIAGVLIYQRWTDPAVVRQQVVEKLHELFPQATVTLDGARLRILGGIVLRELRLSPREDADKGDLVYVPSAVIYHDKEHLLDGKLAFRKVELHRPRLRAFRGNDGRWNLDALMGRARPDVPMPTLVIRQGTILLEDGLTQPGLPSVEIHDVNLTVINDPLATVVVQGSGASDLLGALQIQGTWQRDSGALALSVQAAGIPLTPALVQRLASYCPDKTAAPEAIGGKADLKAELTYHPESGRAFGYDVQCSVRQGKLRHPQIPIPLENVEAAFRCCNGLLAVEKFSATSGPAKLFVHRGARARLPGPEKNFEAVVTVQHLPLTRELAERLPETIQSLHGMFRPEGPASVKIEWTKQDGRWLRHSYHLYPEGLKVCYTSFPYPVGRITGAVEFDYLEGLTKVSLTGFGGEAPVTLEGTWKGLGKAADVNLTLAAVGVPLDKTLIDALPGDLQPVARSFHASGRAHLRGYIRHTPGAEDYHCTYHAQFFDTSVKWDPFPYPLQNVTGFLDVYPAHWEFREFRGEHNGGEVTVKGQTFPPAEGETGQEARMLIEISGRQVALDDDLKKALQQMPGLATAWDTFAPAGRLGFAARIDRVPGQDQDTDIAVDIRGCSIQPRFFPYALNDLSGQFRYHRNRVELKQITARHNDTRLSLEKGTVELDPAGGFYADLSDLRGNPVVPDGEFQKALPETIRAAFETLGVRDPFALQTRVKLLQGSEPGSQPIIWWDGQVWLRQAKLQVGLEISDITGKVGCVGRYDGNKRQLEGVTGNVLLTRATVLDQPFRHVHTRFYVKPEAPEVLVLGLNAPIFGGEISGQARVEFTSTLRYELNLTGTQIDLEEFGRHNLKNSPPLSGIAAARLHLTGQGTGVGSLEGNGTIDIPYSALTKLYNLPLLLDLLKFLGLRWPDRTAFEEAHAAFSIQGNRVHISRLDLLGNVVSLWGRGDVNLDGTDVHLDFYPSWARMDQILPPVIRAIPPAISKQLLKIEMRGNIGSNPNDVRFTKKPLPLLMDPLLQMRDRLAGKKG